MLFNCGPFKTDSSLLSRRREMEGNVYTRGNVTPKRCGPFRHNPMWSNIYEVVGPGRFMIDVRFSVHVLRALIKWHVNCKKLQFSAQHRLPTWPFYFLHGLWPASEWSFYSNSYNKHFLLVTKASSELIVGQTYVSVCIPNRFLIVHSVRLNNEGSFIF